MKSKPKSFFYLLTIIFLGLLGWGLILFTDYFLYDSWWTLYFLKNPAKFWCFEQICHEIGRPLDIFFFYPLTLTNNPVLIAKVIGVSSHILQACLFFRFLQIGLQFSKEDAFWISVIGVTLPFFDLCGEICMFMYGTSPLLFWLAWIIVLGTEWKISLKYLALRLGVWVLFILSFNLNSLLFLFYAVAGILFLSKISHSTKDQLISQIERNFRSFGDLYALPILFWLWKSIFCPLGGIYAEWEYNKINFNFETIVSGYLSFLNLILGEFYQFLEIGVPACLMVIGVSVLTSFLLIKFKKTPQTPIKQNSKYVFLNLVFALLLVVSSVFPYVVTGKLFAEYGWDSRNAVLLNLPFGMFIFMVFKTISIYFKKIPQFFIQASMILFILSGIIMINISTINLQAMGAKQLSLSIKLKEIISKYHPRVISLRDYFQIPKTIYFYPHIMWTYIGTDFNSIPKSLIVDTRPVFPDQIKQNPNGSQEIVVPLVNFDQNVYNHFVKYAGAAFTFSQVPENNDTFTVVVTEGEFGLNGFKIGTHYLENLYSNKDKISVFLNNVTRISVYKPDGNTL